MARYETPANFQKPQSMFAYLLTLSGDGGIRRRPAQDGAERRTVWIFTDESLGILRQEIRRQTAERKKAKNARIHCTVTAPTSV